MPENKIRMKTVINGLGNGRSTSPARYLAALPAETTVYSQIAPRGEESTVVIASNTVMAAATIAIPLEVKLIR